MYSVTARIKDIKQPYGGYVPAKSLTKQQLNDGIILNENENVHPTVVGLAVDYLTRFMVERNARKAFHISIMGAALIKETPKAMDLCDKIKGLDDKSIISACFLCGYDVYFRAGIAVGSASAKVPTADEDTIENIRTMVNRSLSFLNQFGGATAFEVTFEEGGYSDTVSSGDGDFLTKDCLWDIKVSKNSPNSKQTLQILMYYIMGCHSKYSEMYKNEITHIGIYNPRLNIIYQIAVSDIQEETIKAVENDVICYGVKVEQPKDMIRASELSRIFESIRTNVEYVSAQEAADFLHLRKSDVYNLIKSGSLYAVKKGNKYQIPREDLIAFYESRKATQKAMSIIIIVMLAIGLLLACFFETDGFRHWKNRFYLQNTYEENIVCYYEELC